MNMEHFEQQSEEKGGDAPMDDKALKKYFNDTIEDIHKLHEGELSEYPKTDRKGVHALDVAMITREHPIFGEFLGSGDEVLHLDVTGQKKLARIEQKLLDEDITDDDREELLRMFFKYYAVRSHAIQSDTQEQTHPR